jgi:molecular chaperone HtpG
METLTLKAETGRLLDLVIHSLYTKREIFLRELVSNASDALDRLRLEALLRSESLDDSQLEIRLEVDRTARTLTVRDNGIGMSRDEVVSHIGTIARSGTVEFKQRLAEREGPRQAADLIGRFGVGFYSCFMVTDAVTLVTRRAEDPVGTRWESSGDVEYTLTDAPEAPRGTAVTLHLRPVDPGEEIEDYTDRWVLSRIVKRYSDFIAYPIVYVGPGEATAENAEPGVVSVSITLNSMKPIWTRRPDEVKPDEYGEFYKHIANDWEEPLLRLSFKGEGRWEYAALLFVPAHAPYDLYYHAAPYGLQLYSQRTLIVENCQDLLPRYLRFLRGVVDTADLPLNVSRQTLQNASHVTTIRRWLTRKVVDALTGLCTKDPEKYRTLWREFGRALKEGVSEERDQKDRLTPLLLFQSSADPVALTSLADYVARMKPDQQDILYIAGESRALLERSPHLEECRARGYEVLYLTEPVDELLTQALDEFDGHRLRSVAKGQIDLGDADERERLERQTKEHGERLGDLLTFMAKHLEPRVRGVRVSKRLTASPVCLASDEFAYSPHIERLLNNGKGAVSTSRRTLELNPRHAIVEQLHARFLANQADPAIPATTDLLYGIAVLAEGSALPDPVAFTDGVANLITVMLGNQDVAGAC